MSASTLNMGNVSVDFGPVITNGAFRLIHSGKDWQLVPLPNSSGFKVELNLDQLDAGGQKVEAITPTDVVETAQAPVKFQQDGATVHFETAAKVFAYHISLVSK